jgi:YD repeat-containing protein
MRDDMPSPSRSYHHAVEDLPWLDDWIAGAAVPPPAAWGRPGLVLVFSVECAGCVTRAVPWLRRLSERHGDGLVLAAVHTGLGRRTWPRDDVVEAVRRFVAFARPSVPVALDPTGEWAEVHGAEGTPHWFVYDREGRLLRSIFGSQANAMTRLDYLVDELLAS